jgi:hypothetical protein
MNPHVRFSAVAAFAALTWAAAPVAAQSTGQADARDTSRATVAIGLMPATLVDSVTAVAEVSSEDHPTTVVTRGPSREGARVASHAAATRRGAPPILQNGKSNRNAVALMIVGGAALVVGAVIGDDAGTLVMLGGAGIGLYGLYLFLT